MAKLRKWPGPAELHSAALPPSASASVAKSFTLSKGLLVHFRKMHSINFNRLDSLLLGSILTVFYQSLFDRPMVITQISAPDCHFCYIATCAILAPKMSRFNAITAVDQYLIHYHLSHGYNPILAFTRDCWRHDRPISFLVIPNHRYI